LKLEVGLGMRNEEKAWKEDLSRTVVIAAPADLNIFARIINFNKSHER